ncbi:unnamed protein product [Ilex paraguariensis]|uniref:Growth-regulating factor n=1 Tax=Ilex paraguariensis TaxID=185542 RepID=A0ABC8RSG3_9AQUA
MWKGLEGEIVTMNPSAQQWQDFMQTNLELTTGGSVVYNTNASAFQQYYGVEPKNLICYTYFSGDQQSEECNFFINPHLVSIDKQPHIEAPRGFIDAWSNDNPNTQGNSSNINESSVSLHGNLSPSSLTLSMAMAAGNALDEEMGLIKMGLDVENSDKHKTQVSSWQSLGSWKVSTAGGPLAEALRPSALSAGSNPASPQVGNVDLISPPATAVSSPSGLLHRTVLSVSDNSGSNSPNLAATTATPDFVAFRWLN